VELALAAHRGVHRQQLRCCVKHISGIAVDILDLRKLFCVDAHDVDEILII
jgi:hypothetical protein